MDTHEEVAERFQAFLDKYKTRLARGTILHDELIEAFAQMQAVLIMNIDQTPTVVVHAINQYTSQVNENLSNLALMLQDWSELIWDTDDD